MGHHYEQQQKFIDDMQICQSEVVVKQIKDALPVGLFLLDIEDIACLVLKWS